MLRMVKIGPVIAGVIEIEVIGHKRSGIVKIDECSLTLVLDRAWYIDAYGYAYASLARGSSGRKGRNIGMHRLVTNAPDGVEVDHINRDGLDNRVVNLRLCTHMENMRNRRARYDNAYGLKGVTRLRSGRFEAQIGCDGKNHKLGQFTTPEDAHAAYVRAALELHGEFARIA